MNYKKVTSKHNQHDCNMNDRGINKYANRQTNLQSISDPKRCLCLLENRYYLHFLMNENRGKTSLQPAVKKGHDLF